MKDGDIVNIDDNNLIGNIVDTDIFIHQLKKEKKKF